MILLSRIKVLRYTCDRPLLRLDPPPERREPHSRVAPPPHPGYHHSPQNYLQPTAAIFRWLHLSLMRCVLSSECFLLHGSAKGPFNNNITNCIRNLFTSGVIWKVFHRRGPLCGKIVWGRIRPPPPVPLRLAGTWCFWRLTTYLERLWPASGSIWLV